MAKSSFGMRVGTGTITTGGLSTNAATAQAITINSPIQSSPMPVLITPAIPNQNGSQQPLGSQLIVPLPTPLPPTPFSYNFSTVTVPTVVLQAPNQNTNVTLDADGNPRQVRLTDILTDSLSPALRDAAANAVPSAIKGVIGIAGAREAIRDTAVGDYLAKNQAKLGLLSPAAARGLDIPVYPVYRTFPITQIRPHILPPDSLQLSEFTIQNGNVQAVFKNQRVRKRPEIIAFSGYNKVFQEDLIQLSPAGRFVEFNYQSRILRDDMVRTMYDFVAKNSDRTDISTLLEEDERRDLQTLNKADRLLTFYNQSVSITNSLKKSFDIKTLPESAYTDRSMLTLPDFFERKMRYSRQSFEAFSDTKVLSQLLFDYRSMMESYSLSLLDTLDSDRTNDLNPVQIDKTYGNTNRFSFTVVGIQGALPYLEAAFNSFLGSLPTSPDDRIKLLFNTLTKELRVSRGLSKPEIRTLLSNYFGGNADGDPFDNVVGNVGTDIFDAPQGFNSLASLLQFSREDVVTVLPFERRFVDDNQTIFVPGTRYFVDALLERDSDGQFNTKPLDEYTQRFSEVVANSKKVVAELFQLNTDSQTLRNEYAFKSFLEYLKNSTSTFEDNSVPSVEQLIPLALLRLADTDKQLKLMLFQYCLLYGLSKNTTEAKKPIFTRLATELQGLGSLSFVRGNGSPDLQNGAAELSSYLDHLADDIAVKTVRLLGGNETPSGRTQAPVNGVGLGNDVFSGVGISPGDNAQNILNVNDIKRVLLSSFNSTIFTNFVDYIHSLDQAATVIGNQNSYVLGGAGDNGTTTRFNQLTTSMLFMLVFECICSFSNKYFDMSLRRLSDGNLTVQFDLELNSSIWELLYTLTQSQKTKLAETLRARKKTQQGNPAPSVDPKTGQKTQTGMSSGKSKDAIARRIQQISSTTNKTQSGLNPNTDVELDEDGNPRPTSPGGSKTAALQRSIAGRLPDNIDMANKAALTLPPSLADQAREVGVALVGNTNITPLMLRKAQGLRDALRAVMQRLVEEDNTIKNVVYIFDVLGDVMKKTSDQARQLNDLALQNTADETIKSSILPSQLRISNWVYSEYKQMITDPAIQYRSRVVTPADRSMMLSLLREKPYQNNFANTRTKLLVVGIPKGYTDYLLDRVDRRTLNSGDKFAREYEADVVNITVYKKTAEDDDIVFMPQRFTFDLSLFRKQFNSEETDIDQTQPFDALLRRTVLTDFSTDVDNNRDGKRYSLEKFLAEERWEFLGSDQKLQLFKNHVTSHLLSTYLYLATGMRMTEEVFPETPYQNYTNNTGWLVSEFHRLKTGQDLPIASVMATQNYNFLYSVTSGFHEDYIKERALSPKKFDRVFVIPVDIDSFVVDREATLSTQSGRNAVGANRFQQRTLEVRPGDNELLYFDRASEPNALIFEQYYVSVESVR